MDKLVGICLSLDGQTLFVADQKNKCVNLIDVNDGAIRQIIGRGVIKSPHGVCISKDGKKLFVSDNNKHYILVYNIEDGSYLGTLGNGMGEWPGYFRGGIYDVCISPDGNELYVTVSLNDCVAVFRISDGLLVRTIECQLPQSICFSPDGQEIFVLGYSQNYSRIIRVFRATDDTFLRTIFLPWPNMHMQTYFIRISHDGEVIYVSDHDFRGGCVYMFRTSDGTFIQTIGNRGQNPGQFDRPQGICFSLDGRDLYVTDSRNDRVQVFQI